MPTNVLPADTKAQPHPDVMVQRVEDDLLLVHLVTNQIFTLSSTAARLWELLEVGHTLESSIGNLLNEYDVERSELEQDVYDTVNTLIETDLLVLEADRS